MQRNLGFELFYSSGGHGGPYYDMDEARQEAKRRLAGCKSLAFVSIVERTATGISGFGRILEKVVRESADD